MRVLLDESLPRKLASFLTGHQVTTVQARGWAGTKNGALLSLAAAEFDVFVTSDQHISNQQKLSNFSIAVVVVAVAKNRFEDIQPMLPRLREAITSAPAGTTTWVRR